MASKPHGDAAPGHVLRGLAEPDPRRLLEVRLPAARDGRGFAHKNLSNLIAASAFSNCARGQFHPRNRVSTTDSASAKHKRPSSEHRRTGFAGRLVLPPARGLAFTRSKKARGCSARIPRQVCAADRDGLRGAKHSNSRAIARICNDVDRPRPQMHTARVLVQSIPRGVTPSPGYPAQPYRPWPQRR